MNIDRHHHHHHPSPQLHPSLICENCIQILIFPHGFFFVLFETEHMKQPLECKHHHTFIFCISPLLTVRCLFLTFGEMLWQVCGDDPQAQTITEVSNDCVGGKSVKNPQ